MKVFSMCKYIQKILRFSVDSNSTTEIVRITVSITENVTQMLGVCDPEYILLHIVITNNANTHPQAVRKEHCPWTLFTVDYTCRAPIFVLGNEINDKAAAYRISTPFAT